MWRNKKQIRGRLGNWARKTTTKRGKGLLKKEGKLLPVTERNSWIFIINVYLNETSISILTLERSW